MYISGYLFSVLTMVEAMNITNSCIIFMPGLLENSLKCQPSVQAFIYCK